MFLNDVSRRLWQNYFRGGYVDEFSDCDFQSLKFCLPLNDRYDRAFVDDFLTAWLVTQLLGKPKALASAVSQYSFPQKHQQVDMKTAVPRESKWTIGTNTKSTTLLVNDQ